MLISILVDIILLLIFIMCMHVQIGFPDGLTNSTCIRFGDILNNGKKHFLDVSKLTWKGSF